MNHVNAKRCHISDGLIRVTLQGPPARDKDAKAVMVVIYKETGREGGCHAM